MTDQPEALRLAELLKDEWGAEDAVAELLRQHDEITALKAERDAAVELLHDYEDDYKAVVNEQCAGDEVHCSCVPHLRKRIKEVEAERDAAVMKLIAVGHALQGDFGETHPSFRSLELEDAIRLRTERDALQKRLALAEAVASAASAWDVANKAEVDDWDEREALEAALKPWRAQRAIDATKEEK